ncbi:ATP-dependent DNA ligase [Microlunatus panaciterrae]|uniref:DNA ligase (ATP) n=1 Tax=Microlunatus panaciterrae TaxID=400768 RepID=A0ABS2RF62_9ACTN|nr:ATP-dependent DNA ligase [Microlunatus panaciterrae]MBM7797638.1 bifunctional non-homologous end joining protein LigD [Microlunatus panaciterrae]
MARPAETQSVSIGGRRLKISNLDKVLYPATGTTKAEVISYYVEIAPAMLKYTQGRLATRKRWPNGVGTEDHPGQVFFQKDLGAGVPDWVPRQAVQHSDREVVYPLVADVATLTWFAQLAALEIHVPQWRMGADGEPQAPDRLVLDLDPGEGVGLSLCVQVAQLARELLRGMGLEPFPVTSGSKGLHLYAALDGHRGATEAAAVAREIARALEADHPDLVVSDMKKTLRAGKVLVDWSQNNGAKTTIAPYSLRGTERPRVAAPRSWEELSAPEFGQLELSEVLERYRSRGDLLAGLAPSEDEHEGRPEADRLSAYRSKRDAAKTPEPVPHHHQTSEHGELFVIQEHHARRLHWDLRLERNGVLASWALPKGVPTDSAQNHLAVQTEDHPLEYATFQGVIPRGEYGAGEMSIWDAGRYDLHKWREGREVIVTLHGRDGGGLGGPTKVALIHTGGGSRPENHWLIHLMQEDQEPAPVPTQPSRRSTTEIDYAPMLATLGSVDDIREADAWAYEMKWDGIRVLCRIDGSNVTLQSRNGHDVTPSYPELVPSLAELPVDRAVLDGEIVALDAQGRPDFGRLQRRMNVSKPTEVEQGRRSTPVHLMIFDILELNGQTLLSMPYEQRRSLLAEVVPAAGRARIQAPPAFDGDLEAAMATSKTLGLEGVVAKRRGSRYLPGRRADSWVKIKHHRAQEVVVGGWREGQGRRGGGVGSLLLGIFDAGALKYVGGVGTGFSADELAEIGKRLRPLERKTTPFTDIPAAESRQAHWVTPKLVAEVEFSEWTSAGRLRHPSWRGWRPDKEAADVHREE